MNQAATAAVVAVPNPSTTIVAGNTGDKTTSQNSPTVGGGVGATGPSFNFKFWVFNVSDQPRVERFPFGVCELHGFGTVGFLTYRGDRVYLVILPDRGQSIRDVVLSTPPSSGRHVPRWDDDLSVVICLLFVSGYGHAPLN